MHVGPDLQYVTNVRAFDRRTGKDSLHGVETQLRNQHPPPNSGKPAVAPAADGNCRGQWRVCSRLEA